MLASVGPQIGEKYTDLGTSLKTVCDVWKDHIHGVRDFCISVWFHFLLRPLLQVSKSFLSPSRSVLSVSFHVPDTVRSTGLQKKKFIVYQAFVLVGEIGGEHLFKHL